MPPTPMDIHNVELSIEDILNLHRHWITKLYVEERKTEEEIFDALYERRLPVTISQIQRCLQEWNLRPASPSACSTSSISTSTSTTQSSQDLNVTRRTPSPTSSVHSVEPQGVEFYTKRPLPFLPLKSQSSCSSLRGKDMGNEGQGLRPKKDFLKVVRHNQPSRPYEVEMTLGAVPKGPSPLQMYALDQQSHERLAIGLGRVPGLRKYRRGVSVVQTDDNGKNDVEG